jgi:phospholipase D1/2
METSRICVEGKNCCSISWANRVAFLVDGEVYFSALTSTFERAQRFIFISGWQLDSRLCLNPRNAASPRFGDFLHDLVRRNRKLRIYVLLWDFAMIYAADREIIPLYAHPWRTHRRIHFRLDSSHPLGASHHQKIVVIDNAVAFSGGLDIAEHRWDTPDHLPRDPHRVDSFGRLYPPYHDVQLMVDSDAATALGDLVRERWRRATGKRLRVTAGRSGDPWPSGVTPDLQHVPVAISRTEPAYDGRQEVREVESLYLDSIRHARRFIYLENQYLSSSAIGNALAARLQEKDGPEIIMVLPQETSEWLEQVSMAVLRSRLLRRLRAADRFGRLHVYYPVLQDENVQVRVHSKVCFIDDRLLRVGSANLNNRSMGLDTECDLAVEAEEPATGNSIASLRNRLLAEHLGVSPERVAKEHSAERSLVRAIEKLRGGKRTLGVLDGSVSPALDDMIPAAAIIDPERPLIYTYRHAPARCSRSAAFGGDFPACGRSRCCLARNFSARLDRLRHDKQLDDVIDGFRPCAGLDCRDFHHRYPGADAGHLAHYRNWCNVWACSWLFLCSVRLCDKRDGSLRVGPYRRQRNRAPDCRIPIGSRATADFTSRFYFAAIRSHCSYRSFCYCESRSGSDPDSCP